MKNTFIFAFIAIVLTACLGCNNGKATLPQTERIDSATHSLASHFSMIKVFNWGPEYFDPKRTEFAHYQTPLCFSGRDTIRVFIPEIAGHPEQNDVFRPKKFLMEKGRMDPITKLPLVTEIDD